MKRKLIVITDDLVKDLKSLYDLAERYVGSAQNIVQPIWERIAKAVVEENEPENKE
jgi:hypothetical protein